jgi:hypothetical protein
VEVEGGVSECASECVSECVSDGGGVCHRASLRHDHHRSVCGSCLSE